MISEFDSPSLPRSKLEPGIDIETGDPCNGKPESNGSVHGSVHGVRFEEVVPVRARDRNGLVVYRRNKRLKRAANVDDSGGGGGGGVEPSDASKCNSGGGKIVHKNETEGISGIPEMVEIEVKEESTLAAANRDVSVTGSSRRFTRSALKLNVEPLDENLEVLEEEELITCGEVHDSNNGGSKKRISIIGRPTTVKELFETGLLEGYPVFYNGGKRVINAFLA